MARTALRTNINHNKGFHGFGFLSVLLLMQRAVATPFKVGGASGWTVPTDPTAYNQWAEKNRFKTGDTLLFVYPPDKDSVLQVTKDDYSNCNTKSSIASFNDGNTSFRFNQSGAYYFISGNEGNCLKNESMVVVVLSDRTNRSSISTSSTTTASPLPPPLSSPPSSAPEINPTSPPPSALPPAVVETPNPSPPSPPNGVPSSKVVSFVGSIGVLGSWLVLVL